MPLSQRLDFQIQRESLTFLVWVEKFRRQSKEACGNGPETTQELEFDLAYCCLGQSEILSESVECL